MKFSVVHSPRAAMYIRSLRSCQALRKIAELPRIVSKVEVTPEWLAENPAKQAELARHRAERSA